MKSGALCGLGENELPWIGPTVALAIDPTNRRCFYNVPPALCLAHPPEKARLPWQRLSKRIRQQGVWMEHESALLLQSGITLGLMR